MRQLPPFASYWPRQCFLSFLLTYLFTFFTFCLTTLLYDILCFLWVLCVFVSIFSFLSLANKCVHKLFITVTQENAILNRPHDTCRLRLPNTPNSDWNWRPLAYIVKQVRVQKSLQLLKVHWFYYDECLPSWPDDEKSVGLDEWRMTGRSAAAEAASVSHLIATQAGKSAYTPLAPLMTRDGC